MNKFQKLNCAEMRNVTGGNWVIIGCVAHCTDASPHGVNSGTFNVDSCDPIIVGEECMGDYVDWCQCYSEPISQ